MGKIRRERKKNHIKSAKPIEEDEDVSMLIKENEEEKLSAINFKNILTTGASPINDCKSKEPAKITSVQNEHPIPTTKKGKRLLRHEKFLTKLQIGFESKTKIKEKKKREKTVIVGDMQPLVAALPDFDALFNENNQNKVIKSRLKKSEKKVTKKPSKRLKSKMKNNLKDIDLFKQVLQHPKFLKSPSDAMNDHVTYLIENQDE